MPPKLKPRLPQLKKRRGTHPSFLDLPNDVLTSIMQRTYYDNVSSLRSTSRLAKSTTNRLPIFPTLRALRDEYAPQRAEVANRLKGLQPIRVTWPAIVQHVELIGKAYAALEKFATRHFHRMMHRDYQYEYETSAAVNPMTGQEMKGLLEELLPRSLKVDVDTTSTTGLSGRPVDKYTALLYRINSVWPLATMKIHAYYGGRPSLHIEVDEDDHGFVHTVDGNRVEKITVTLKSFLESRRHSERTGVHTVDVERKAPVLTRRTLPHADPHRIFAPRAFNQSTMSDAQLQYLTYFAKLLKRLGFPRPRGKLWLLLEAQAK
jgi:hypothetical protein